MPEKRFLSFVTVQVEYTHAEQTLPTRLTKSKPLPCQYLTYPCCRSLQYIVHTMKNTVATMEQTPQRRSMHSAGLVDGITRDTLESTTVEISADERVRLSRTQPS